MVLAIVSVSVFGLLAVALSATGVGIIDNYPYYNYNSFKIQHVSIICSLLYIFSSPAYEETRPLCTWSGGQGVFSCIYPFMVNQHI